MDLKMSVLRVAMKALETKNVDLLWRECFPCIANALLAEEAEFLIRMDMLYSDFRKPYYTDILLKRGPYTGRDTSGGLS
ncbi:MAG: hypothetical protein KKH67_07610, partial [candidate division Zixibacteria bacterium]|nr:hypothetical protein [candidate division Zixibacteria bacterium]MBU1469050.1 hypothetical protein [candidate division Zixibacteria bacterium]